ncbi:uncharacterized protein [Diabrotica undecimpunctata]|uniref:uncharacterized protein n=1 Tax=Diabrotica undecimpunctata TaxID=50387 RepID=UPI003B640647
MDENSNTEQEISDTEGAILMVSAGPFFLGKNTTTKHIPPRNVRTHSENLITHLPGAKEVTKNLKGELGICKYFFNDTVINIIVEFTNIHIKHSQENYNRENNAKEIGALKIRAFIGLLYLAGVLKSGRLSTDELWNKDGSGSEMFQLTMSRYRFKFLLQHLRIDDTDLREERKLLDKFCPIREIFEMFTFICKNGCTPFEYVTIDEKLEAFRGRCSFKQYIPNKPNIGLKIFALADSKTFYTCNLEPYLGQQPPGSFVVSNSLSELVNRLCEPLR